MFDSLSSRLSGILDKLTRRGALTETDVAEALREVRRALLEADVALDVVRSFTDKVRARAVGAEVVKSVTPGQMVVKIVHDVLVETLGAEAEPISLNAVPPVPILMVGLQGSGKTTTTAKIAKRLSDRQGKRVLMASLDTRRPAAMEQLAVLGSQTGISTLPIIAGQNAVQIARRAVEAARLGGYDVVMLDTAGRTTVDDELMNEAAEVKAVTQAHETLLVADALTGQDAVNTARAFEGRLDLTGIVLTRVDGDGRGGAALSMRAVTGKPIKLMGVGEKIDALEDFHPARIANRILGMGDIVSLVEKAAETIDRDKALAIAEKMRKGRFDLVDLREQLTQMSKLDDRMVKRQLAIIDSMTPRERANPEILKASRKRRIAAGSGTTPEHINRLLKMHRQMADMMKMMGRGKGGMMGKMASMFGMGGGDPLADLDLSALTPEQLETIKRELGGQLPPGFPGALASGAGAPAGTEPRPRLSASFPGGLVGGKPSGLPGLGGVKLPGLGGGFPGLPGGLNPFGGKKK